MFAQCSHCKAVFRVTMKEITTAQGRLRCGECDHVFNAMDTLSNTLPAEYQNKPIKGSQSTDAFREKETRTKQDKPFFTKPLWMSLAIGFLVLLLLMQILYTSRNWLAHQPMTSGLTRTFCKVTGCEITPQKDVSKIDLLSKNVYAHPNDPNTLIVTASLKNLASHQQPFPLIEVSFLNDDGIAIALQRFRPESYANLSSSKKYFLPGETQNFRIKISDPGRDAVRFQFRFL